MRIAVASLLCVLLQAGAWGQSPAGPTDPKAQKSFAKGQANLLAQQYEDALSNFKKADKQDGGTCVPCQEQIIEAAIGTANFKAGEPAALALVAEAKDPRAVSLAHFAYGKMLLREAMMEDEAHKKRRRTSTRRRTGSSSSPSRPVPTFRARSFPMASLWRICIKTRRPEHNSCGLLLSPTVKMPRPSVHDTTRSIPSWRRNRWLPSLP